MDEFHNLLSRRRIRVLYPPKTYPQHGKGYYAVFFLDPDGIDLEVFHWRNHHRIAADEVRTRASARG